MTGTENRTGRAPVIAIDGPAGAGKSTVAIYLARRFGLLNLETGAMYRALALKALTTKTPPDDGEALLALTGETAIELKPGEAGNTVLLDGVDVTSRLRAPEVTAAASRVSVHGPVRAWMVAQQRAMGLASPVGVVMEGRDIGTAVFPDAAVKIFLDASPEARGDRRSAQQPSAGAPGKITAEMRERDDRDRSRAASPLRPADDAVHLDTTAMALDEVLAHVEQLVKPFFNEHKAPKLG